LQKWIAKSPVEPPSLILNKHCPYCQFRKDCKEKAEKDDDLSLLDHMTPKLIQKYHKKGIFYGSVIFFAETIPMNIPSYL